ncbi:alpha/beta hydrolase [Alicyclobacillus sp. ALC3]|uniref:alpha/beta hydrolase n=1 Tax=Alicyclobacillus sp. ALC3 TaxID=2796143 RepID=UPI0023792769|nr:alpha/beta hydrolase-fold protein [Alicyclobacillus sp. ALC3]WDL98651.1 esterase family protein [Alicyclobacillus sp. ALC3]
MPNTTSSSSSFDARYTRRVVEAHSLYSTHLQEERTIKVCLPPGYDSTRNYPVVYCQDGNEFFTHGRIATISNQMVAEGRLDPLLIVGIAVNRAHRTEDYAVGGARSEAYRQFVANECVPYVESQYRVDAGRRILAGVSLGAAASLNLALSDTASFPWLLLFSGAFYPEAQSAARFSTSLSDLSCYMIVGRQETKLETDTGTHNFHRLSEQMRDILIAGGADVSYHEGDGEHLWGFWQAHLPDALEFVQSHVK